MTEETVKISTGEIAGAIDNMASAIAQKHAAVQTLTLVAIANGGIILTQRLFNRLKTQFKDRIHLGTIDITFHRDDIFRRPIPKASEITDLPQTIEEGVVILVDDVLFSGRSSRAAINELFDQGRPERVELAVFVDRGHQRLPIRADYVGITLKTDRTDKVLVHLDATAPDNDNVTIQKQLKA